MQKFKQILNKCSYKLLTFYLLSACFIQLMICQENVSEFTEHAEAICMEPDVKRFPLITLGYVTPFDIKGFEIALKYAIKFDIVSPTYFEIRPEVFNNEFNVKIDGSNHVNTDFLSELREINPAVKILPRFKCEDFKDESFKIWMEEENSAKFVKILMRRLNYSKFDGLVLECNMVWLIESVYDKFEIFLKNLSENLKKQGKSLILTVYPYSEVFVQYLTKARFEEASKYVDYFNIMAYDYYTYQSEEKENFEFLNSPISWIKKSIEHYVDFTSKNKDSLLKKILLGVPFYGAIIQVDDNKPEFNVLDGTTMTNLLKGEVVSLMEWDEKEKENTFYSTIENYNYLAVFPTNKFYKERLKYIIDNKLGGIAVWEIAQGIDNFFDEF